MNLMIAVHGVSQAQNERNIMLTAAFAGFRLGFVLILAIGA